ncbi:acyltransferase family protein [Puerhibacterium puerhi]|uniref:acyltransferase family protein n=1 Tax=Puerhibacterium puerhi TaxID=2692623 RepID=UPI00135BDB22|nr:acyltransferase [Puerhibacterium puerhi]
MTRRSPRPEASGRLHSLDGLRGVAAVIVLLHHTALLIPAFAATYKGGDQPQPGTLEWSLARTPLHLLVAGPEAVLVFFVLSGLVLALPVLRRPAYDWMSYYPSRLVRLGVPVAASVALAAVWILVVPATQRPASVWTHSMPFTDLSWKDVVVALDLVSSSSYPINNPLWSIRWELLFSLALPLYVAAALWLRRRWLVVVLVTPLVTYAGYQTSNGALHYLPVFFLGTLLAASLPQVQRLLARCDGLFWRLVAWPLVTLAALAVLVMPWLAGHGSPELTHEVDALRALGPLGALAVVVTALGWTPLRRLLETRPFQAAGRYSFSLYLVHVPVIMAVAWGPAGGLELRYRALLCVAVSAVVAVAFFHLVERHSHTLARRVGKRVSAAIAARQPAAAAPVTPAERTTQAAGSGR